MIRLKHRPNKPRYNNAKLDKNHPLYCCLVAAWLMNEFGGETIYDSAHGHIGTAQGTTKPWFENRGTYFATTNDNNRYDLGSISSADRLCMAGGVWTVVSELYLAGGGDGSSRIIDKSDGGAFVNGWGAYFTNGKPSAGMNGSFKESSTTDIRDTGWRTVAIGITANKSAFSYIDGVHDGTSATQMTSSPSFATTNAAIGNWNHSTARAWFGFFTYIYVFDRVLTAAEIASLYVNPYQIYESNLDAHFRVAQAYTLAMDSGPFTLTGADATLNKGFTLGMAVGNFALSGADANFLRGYVASLESGAFTLTGADIEFLYGRVLEMESGSFTLSGADADLLRGYVFDLEAGVFTLSGADVGLNRGYIMPSDGGSFVLTGAAADFIRGYVFVMSGGTFVLTGNVCNLRYSVLSGEIVITFSQSQPTVTFS